MRAGAARTRRRWLAPIASGSGTRIAKTCARRRCANSNAGDWSFLDSILGQGKDLGVYTVPGDGMIDYVSVFKALKGYSGWGVLEAEQDPKKAPALAYAKRESHLGAALKEAGLV